MKKRYMAFVMCVLLCAAVFLPAMSKADFGSFSGDSDYGGGSDWGGSSSWDDDDSYGGSTYISGGGGGGDDGFSLPVAVIVAIFILLSIFKKKGKSPGSSSNRPAGAQRTAAEQMQGIYAYKGIDPAFDEMAMQERISNLYVQMQNGWQDKNIEALRPYFTDALFTQMERQLAAFRTQNKTNYIERIAVLGVVLRGFYQRNGEDHIVAELRTRIVDYTLDDNTGALVSGSKTAEKFMTYEWDLSRATGMMTGERAQMENVHCPSCGAPLSINTTAKCPYCDGIVTLKEHDWAISAIKGIAQQTR